MEARNSEDKDATTSLKRSSEATTDYSTSNKWNGTGKLQVTTWLESRFIRFAYSVWLFIVLGWKEFPLEKK